MNLRRRRSSQRPRGSGDKYVIRGCRLCLRGVTVRMADGVLSGIVSILVWMPIHTCKLRCPQHSARGPLPPLVKDLKDSVETCRFRAPSSQHDLCLRISALWIGLHALEVHWSGNHIGRKLIPAAASFRNRNRYLPPGRSSKYVPTSTTP
jgi:hypothetical protein